MARLAHLVRKSKLITACLLVVAITTYCSPSWLLDYLSSTVQRRGRRHGVEYWIRPTTKRPVDIELHSNAIPRTASDCSDLAGADEVAVIVRTSAAEVINTLPMQLASLLRCVQHPIIVSDLEQRLGRNTIHDVLAGVSPDTMEHPDFDLYKKQQQLQVSGREAELRLLAPNTAGHLSNAKYISLHMLELAWQVQPSRQWYVFINGDTYLNWQNLLHLLQVRNPKGAWYFGSPVTAKDDATSTRAADGPGAFVLSGQVLHAWNANKTGLAASWDERIRVTLSDDDILATALQRELNVQLTDATPMFGQSQIATMPFGQSLWCKAVVALDHLDSRQIDDFYQLERSRKDAPLLYRDLFTSFHPSGLPFKRSDWDNGAGDERYALRIIPTELGSSRGQWEPKDLIDPHGNMLACEVACIQNEACFQFAFVTVAHISGPDPDVSTTCHLSRVFRMGVERLPESLDGEGSSTTTWHSGWRSDRIARWVKGHEDCRT